MAKRAVGSSGEGGEPADIDEHRKIAARAVEILGNMKGLAMKLGNLLG